MPVAVYNKNYALQPHGQHYRHIVKLK